MKMNWLTNLLSRRPPIDAPRPPVATPPAVYQLHEVFRSTGIPSVTLIDRSKTPSYYAIKSQLENGGLISVYGDSKSGKTVLCMTILEPHNPILLRGPLIQSEEIFWNVLAKKLGLPRETAYKQNSSHQGKLDTTFKLTAGNDHFPLKVTGTLGAEETRTSYREVMETFTTFEHDIVDRLTEQRRPLVIDDFHSVPKDAQRAVVFKLKPAIDLGGSIVVISIPEETKEIIQGLTSDETTGRYAMIPAPEWSNDDIKQIPQKGFRALKVVLDDIAVDRMVKAAYHNPLLMQDYCRQLCVELGVERTLPAETRFAVEPRKLDRIVWNTASRYEATYAAYLGLAEDGEGTWKLITGRMANLNALVVLALHGIGVNSPIKLATIRDRIGRILAADEPKRPKEPDIALSLTRMTKRMSGKQHLALLRYDDDNVKTYAYITHPFFRVFLQWSVLPKYERNGELLEALRGAKA